MATANPTQGVHAASSLIKKASGWLIAIGVLFVVLGLSAIAEPLIAGLAIAFLVGWLLIIGGAMHFVAAFGGGGIWRVIVQILIGIVYVLGGVYFLTHPLLGLGTLTLLLAGIILAVSDWPKPKKAHPLPGNRDVSFTSTSTPWISPW